MSNAPARGSKRVRAESGGKPLGILISIHLFGVIFWIGSLLLITSLLGEVSEEVGVAKERFILVASNLFYGGCNIGGAIALLFGIFLMIAEPSVIHQGWLLAKIGLVVILLGVHIRLHRRIVDLSDKPGAVARREFRVIHGLVSALLLAILMLAIIKPF
ncbi:MAG TPA: CopD family protein [Candidatus Binataceae bacterium]|nr:CopD family protein [Candidatus Binataceae bacterium]